MRKALLALALQLLCLGAAHAQEVVQVYATKMETEQNVLNATGDVLILYQDYYLGAKSARYDRDAGVIELYGNVTVIKGTMYHMLGAYARFDIGRDQRRIEPFYLLEKESRVWMSCDAATSDQEKIDLSSGMISGCDPNDPIWKLRFSSSDYDTKTKWLNLYNARIVIGEVPIFYLPYFGYSLDTTRRSGLLLPSFGISGREGFYYQQPIYIAEQNWWDLELRPQIRTKRGQGLYGITRFVDSDVSSGSLNFGMFKEDGSYAQEFNLENNNHYGINFHYENQDFLKQWSGIDSGGQSGIYADINWMNDIEYINLANDDETLNATSSQVFSRLNLFYNEEKNYFGGYAKYYLDLTQENNDETVQNLPTLHYHRYLETWFDDHLFYNVNVNAKNYYRKVGVSAQEYEASVPLTLHGTLFEDFFDWSLGSQLYGKYISFDDSTGAYDSGRFGRSTHTLQVGTHLSRGYETLTHTVGLDVSYVKNGAESRNGYFESNEAICETDPNNDICDFYKITDIEETTQLEFSQYLFDLSGSRVLYHRLTQAFSSSDNKPGELENELEWQFTDALSFYSDTVYDHDIGKPTKQVTSLRYEGEQYDLSLNHFYEAKSRHGRSTDSSYLTTNLTYRYDSRYSYFARYDYDVENGINKNAQIGFLYSKRCWDFGLRYVELNRPVLESGGVASSIYDKYIYMTLILKPMGGSDFQYQLNDMLGGS